MKDDSRRKLLRVRSQALIVSKETIATDEKVLNLLTTAFHLVERP